MATAAVETQTPAPASDLSAPPEGPTLTGLDRLVAEDFAPLVGRTVGLITNQTGIDAQGRRGMDLLVAAPQVRVRALFSPEHGITGQVDAGVPHGRDAATGLPIWSLYGPTRRPSPEMLNGIDTLVFDIQDVGVRYYTYLTTLVYALEESGRRGIQVMVLDRPNPITGRVVEGPLMDPDMRSFTAPHTIPVRTGMTIGEFAQMVVAERKLPVKLTVVPLERWQRGQWFDETGLPWVNPSPNIRNQTQALLYSGVGLLEATNLSVGRGTDTPFEVVGAPWISDPEALADAMNAATPPSPASRADAIDRICDDFERAWHEGRQPRLEEYLAAAEEPLRSPLWAELIRSELACRRVGGVAPALEEYLGRFPDRREQLERLFAGGNTLSLGGTAGRDRPAVEEWPDVRIDGYELLNRSTEQGKRGVLVKRKGLALW